MAHNNRGKSAAAAGAAKTGATPTAHPAGLGAAIGAGRSVHRIHSATDESPVMVPQGDGSFQLVTGEDRMLMAMDRETIDIGDQELALNPDAIPDACKHFTNRNPKPLPLKQQRHYMWAHIGHEKLRDKTWVPVSRNNHGGQNGEPPLQETEVNGNGFVSGPLGILFCQTAAKRRADVQREMKKLERGVHLVSAASRKKLTEIGGKQSTEEVVLDKRDPLGRNREKPEIKISNAPEAQVPT